MADGVIPSGGRESKVPPIEVQPEYVGAHSNPVAEECQQWVGDRPTKCDQKATHTVVMYDGELHEVASCDDCGEVDDVTDFDRRWSA